MSQLFLTNFSIIVLKYTSRLEGQQKTHTLGNQSIIRSEVFFEYCELQSHLENQLFQVEIEGNNKDFKLAIEFQKPIYLKHKLSNKYLSYSSVIEDEQNDSTVKLELSDMPCFFKFMPCFQYQTKISNKIKFHQDVYLATELSSAKLGYVSVRPSDTSNVLRTILGLNFKEKLMLHCYDEIEEEETGYLFGSTVWLTHVDSQTFLTVVKSAKQEQIFFQPLNREEEKQSTSGLWLIDSIKTESGGSLHFNQHFYLKSLCTKKYLTLSPYLRIAKGDKILEIIRDDNVLEVLKGEKQFKVFRHEREFLLVKGQKVYRMAKSQSGYQMIREDFQIEKLEKQLEQFKGQKLVDVSLEDRPNPNSKFIFQSLKGEENKIKKKSYLIFKHLKTETCLGTRKQKESSGELYYPLIIFDYFEDQDLFKISQTEPEDQETFRFIFSFKDEQMYISQQLQQSKRLSKKLISEILNLDDNILKEFSKLINLGKFMEVQEAFTGFMDDFYFQVKEYRYRLNSEPQERENVTKLIKNIYLIMRHLCKDYKDNQDQYYKHLDVFIEDIFMNHGAQELIVEIVRNNYGILCKLPDNLDQLGGKNLIKRIFECILRVGAHQKTEIYWKQMIKIFQMLEVCLYYNQVVIDINQRLVATELFEGRLFDRLFFEIKAVKQRIKINHPIKNQWFEMDQIKEPVLITVIEKIFKMFSSICEDRNFIGKNYVHEYLNQEGPAGVKIIINYLGVPVSPQLSNNLYSLITNCYIDSSPRINRTKPLSVILFNVEKDLSKLQEEKSVRLGLLDKKPKSILSPAAATLSNMLTSFEILEPSLNEQELDLYKQQLNERIAEECWTSELLNSICILIRLECYSTAEIQNIKGLLEEQLMQKSLDNNIIPFAMQILEELNIYCEQIEIKKITAYLKYQFSKKKKGSLNSYNVKNFLPHSQKLRRAIVRSNNPDHKYVIMEPDVEQPFRQQYNDYVDILSKLYPSQQLKEHLFEMFIDSQKYSFSIISSLFRQLIRYNFPKLKMMRLLSKCIVITGDEVNTFQELFDLYKKLNHLNCISEHWLYSKYDKPLEYKHFVQALVEITNYMFEQYELFSKRDVSFRKQVKLNINRQLLINNLAVSEIVINFIGANYYLLDQSNRLKLSATQRHTFIECFEYLFYFCYQCSQNTKAITSNIEVIEKLRGSLEVGQTKLLNMLYRTDDTLVKQVSMGIVETAISKIITKSKNIDYQRCEYSPEYVSFLLNIAYSKGKPNKKNIAFVQKILHKETKFKALLFLDKSDERFIALDISNFNQQPLRIPILYHKQFIKLMCIIIQNLQTVGTRIRNRLKNYISLEQLFRLLGLPDIYSHNGVIPSLNHLLKKELFVLLNLYLEKNDSLNKLYESRSLQAMLDHFILIFLTKPPKKNMIQPGEQAMGKYLQEYRDEVNYDKQNQRDFYNATVHPMLSRLFFIFDKMSNKQNNINFKKINLLLEEIKPLELNQNHLLKNIRYGMDLIDLNWRNFVDADQDNSAEQKFTKKTILELLKHDVSFKQIQKERQLFYQILAQKEQQYFKVMGNFIKIASEEDTFGMSQDSELIFYEIIQQLAQYLHWTMSKGRQFNGLQGKVIVETLIGYVKRPQFQYSNQISRKTFYQILRIFVILLENDQEEELQKVFYNYFKTQISSYRFLSCLNSALMEVFDRIEGEKIHEQINFALGQLTLCGEEKKCEIDKQALKLITNLCKYSPFTDFFRDQPYAISIDFLQRIFNLFYIMIKRNNSSNINITISVVDIVEPLVECMVWMMNGCNETNQNYIIESKFPATLVEILKKESIKSGQDETDIVKRDMLLQEVVAFYESNGINIKDLLLQNIKYLDFKHNYLLNRFKYILLRLLHQCTLANDRVLSKLKITLPLQLLKINIIWTYYDFAQENQEYSEETVLREMEDWRSVVAKDDVKGTFLMVGFYFYIFIQYYKNEDKQSKDEDEAETVQDEQKQKQRVIKKFFSSISDKEKRAEKQKALEKEQFGKEMARFYKDYYTAYKFYRSKTLTIEANIYDKLTKIYFPKIPLCDELTQKMESKLVEEAERISHQEKIKSLMEFEEQCYSNLNGQETYFKEMEEKSSTLAFLIKLVKREDDIFLIIWAVSVLITINYLLYDYVKPYHYFNELVGHFLIPKDFLSVFMLVLELISLFFGIVLLLNLILKKVPYLVEIYKARYEKEKEQREKKGKNDQDQDSYAIYLATNLFKTTALDFYIMVFSFLTIVHPLFAGFQLIYIIDRIAIGKQIIVAIKQTAFSLFAATGLLVICNYVYAMLIYVAFTNDIGYGGTCQTLFKCFLMVFDQSLKGDSGFLGNAETDYTYNVFTMKFLCEIFYILFVKKVIFEIFSGTIIDKFSELRQKEQDTEKDQKSNCYICGLERFEIDFELEGFEEHTKNTHNKLNYIFYLFYLRRKKNQHFGIEENYIWKLHQNDINDWIPDETSLLKQEKEGEGEEEQAKNQLEEYQKYFGRKMTEMKKLKQRMEFMSTQLKQTNL